MVAMIGIDAYAAECPHYVVVATEHTDIENNPAYLDLRPNDADVHLYLWEQTLTGSMGEEVPYEGAFYSHLVVNSGWFGLGFVNDNPIDFSLFGKQEMVLHFAMRTTATCPMFVKLESPGYPGFARIDLTGAYDLPRDGEWHVVEIPMSAFTAQGLTWRGKMSGKNFFTIVSEQSSPGQWFDIDYVYFHNGVREDGSVYQNPFESAEVDPSLPAYWLIASEHNGIEHDANYVDMRPDNVSRFLYVWENTAEAYEPQGEPFEGGQFSCLHVTAPAGWFGFGCVSSAPVDFSPLAKQPCFLRFAVKTSSLMPLFVKLEGLNNSSAIVYLQGEYEFSRDGEWHLIEIPMSRFFSQGLDWNGSVANKVYFSLVSEKADKDYLVSFDGVWIEAGSPAGSSVEPPVVDVEALPDFVMVACEDGVVPDGMNCLDLRPDGSSINLYVWEGTATEAPADGEAFEGSQYSALQVQGSWFGFGIMNSAPFDFTCFAYKNFYLHMALKTTSEMPLVVKLEGRNEASLAIEGEYGFKRDGEWHELIIPMADFFSQGLVWNGMMEGKNFFSLLSEKVEPGAVIAFDAIYFYADGNAPGGVHGAVGSTQPTFCCGRTIYLGDATAPTMVCNLAGQPVFVGTAVSIDATRWAKGFYVVRNGVSVTKIIIK